MRISDWSSDVCSSDLRGRAWIISLDQLAHPEADEELHDEIDGQRDRDPDDVAGDGDDLAALERSEEHTSELQSLMRISYAVFCLKKKNTSSQKLLIQNTKYNAYSNNPDITSRIYT